MIDKILGLFQSGEKIPDLLKVLELDEWYSSLSEDEQQKLYEYSTAFGAGGEYNQLNKPVQSTSQTQQGYLKGVGEKALSDKDYEFAEQILLKALDADDSNPTDKHFVYNSLIKLYYKQREDREDAIENCIKYCKKDIDSINGFLDAWDGEPPRISAFKRLAIIYDKQENYREAIEICDKALKLGLSDGTKGGFEGRKERLQNKIAQ